MRSAFFFLALFIGAFNCAAQTVQGFVLNKDTRLRLAKTYIYNTRTEDGVYNNSKGEFTISIQHGDVLVAALEGYGVDTVVYNGQSAIYFQLQPLGINIQQVVIQSIMLTPQEKYLKARQDNKYAIDRGSTKNIFSLGPNGAGLNIDAIYNLLSRQGKNARRLQAILERDYKESIIDYRFKPDAIGKMLQISGPELKDFMLQYRPTYSFVLSASDYTFALFVKNSYASYKRAPDAFRLPPLPSIGPKEE